MTGGVFPAAIAAAFSASFLALRSRRDSPVSKPRMRRRFFGFRFLPAFESELTLAASVRLDKFFRKGRPSAFFMPFLLSSLVSAGVDVDMVTNKSQRYETIKSTSSVRLGEQWCNGCIDLDVCFNTRYGNRTGTCTPPPSVRSVYRYPYAWFA